VDGVDNYRDEAKRKKEAGEERRRRGSLGRVASNGSCENCRKRDVNSWKNQGVEKVRNTREETRGRRREARALPSCTEVVGWELNGASKG